MKVKGKIRARFTRGLRRVIFKEKSEVNRMDNNTVLYSTTFVNRSDAHWQVREKGRELLIVRPGEEASIESWKATTDWSRWLKVVREKDYSLSLTENPSWSNPWQGQYYCLELINEDGSPEESIPVVEPSPAYCSARGYVTAVRGIPRIIPLDVMDSLVKWSKIIWHKKEIRVPVPGTKYFTTEWQVVKEMVPRPKHDLKNVLKERQAIAAEKLKEETAQAMREQEKLLMAEEA